VDEWTVRPALPNSSPQFAKARNHYRSLDLVSRLESASPHGLVAILYEELSRALDVIAAALRQGRDVSREPNVERARSILVALIGSLDFDHGGSLAQTLAQVYRSMMGQLAIVVAEGDADKLGELRDGVASVEDAWARLV
jgi:flagellar secretion chaperone FliS